MGAKTNGQGKKMQTLAIKTQALALLLSLASMGNSAMAADMQSGIKKYNAKQYQAALNDFKEVVRLNPKDALCHYYMALCNQCLARIGEAKLEYEKVTQIGPPNLKAQAQAGLNQLGKVSVRTGGASGGSSSSTEAGASGTAGATAGASAGSNTGNSPVATSGQNGAGTYTPPAGKGGKDAALADAKKQLPAIKQIIMFYSDSSPGCASMQDTWDEAKVKYKALEFTRLNVADNSNAEMVNKYGVNSYPTTVMIDQSGKAVFNQAGPILGDAFSSTIDTYLKKK